MVFLQDKKIAIITLIVTKWDVNIDRVQKAKGKRLNGYYLDYNNYS